MSIHALQLGSELVRRSADIDKSITNLSLQKLAYFCHGWHLALLNTPLVDESFEAWKLGPVLPTLYHTYKVFSSNPISVTHPIVSEQPSLPVDSDSAKIINVVFDAYARFSSTELVTRSHEVGGPWEQVWQDRKSGGTIPDAAIQQHFAKLARREQ